MDHLLRADGGGGFIQVLIIILFVVFSILGQRKKRPRPQPEEQPIDLDEVFRRLSGQPPATKPSASAPSPGEAAGDEAEEEGRPSEEEGRWEEELAGDPREGEAASEASPEIIPRQEISGREATAYLNRLAAIKAALEQGPPTSLRPAAVPPTPLPRSPWAQPLYQRQTLRQNLVLAEILAPPLALRRNPRRRRYL